MKELIWLGQEISKSVFVDLLGEIWDKCLWSSNSILGFRAAYIYPEKSTCKINSMKGKWNIKKGIMEELSTGMHTPQTW